MTTTRPSENNSGAAAAAENDDNDDDYLSVVSFSLLKSIEENSLTVANGGGGGGGSSSSETAATQRYAIGSGGIANPACLQDEDDTELDAAAAAAAASSSGSPRVPKLPTQQQQQQQQQRQHTKNELQYQENSAPRTIPPARNILRHLLRKMTVCYARVPWRLSPNFVVAVTLSVLMLLGVVGLIPNQTIGFYCGDPKIAHKFTGDTVSMGLLLVVTVLLPLLVIWLVEWMYYSPDSYRSLENSSSASSSRSRQFWKWYGYYTIGWYYLVFCVEVLKIVVGEPRPHFIDSCQPKEIANCTDAQYIQRFTCTNTKLSWFYVRDSDKSFPSGHAALSMFTATFLTWYLQSRMPNRVVLVLIKPWLQCSAMLWGLGCGMTRVIDHRHHWWDVGIGYILGILFGIFVVRVMCKSFGTSRNVPGNLSMIQPNGNIGSCASCTTSSPKDYASGMQKKTTSGNHQSVKKLLSTSSSIDTQDERELGDIPSDWTNP